MLPGRLAALRMAGLVLGLTVSTANAIAGDRVQEADRTGSSPVQFHSEVVRMFVGLDSVTVEGDYRLVCRRSVGGVARLLYPYPKDIPMGGARSVSLERRSPGGGWRSLAFREMAGNLGAAWTISMDPGDTVDVRTVYRQALIMDFARYIVTTTRSWGEPLTRARFEIFLPPGASPESFSFPFAPGRCGGYPCYVYEATQFLPDRDIDVRWRTDRPGERP